jgi:hypothetical protein
VSPVKYELGFYIPEDGILHSHRREDLKSYVLKNYSRGKGENKNALISTAVIPTKARTE